MFAKLNPYKIEITLQGKNFSEKHNLLDESAKIITEIGYCPMLPSQEGLFVHGNKTKDCIPSKWLLNGYIKSGSTPTLAIHSKDRIL